MAKNLKLNIKNTQLAEALKLNKLKTAPSALKKTKKPVIEEAAAKEEHEKALLPPLKPVEESATAFPKEEKEPLKEKLQVSPPLEEKKAEVPSIPKTAAPTPSTTPSERTSGGFKPREETRPSHPFHVAPRKEGQPVRHPFPSREYRPQPRPPIAPKEPVRAQESSLKKPSKPPGVEEEKPVRKAGFKEYRDLKPQRKLDAQRTFDSRDKQGLRDSDDEEWRKRRPSKSRGFEQQEEVMRPKTLKVRLPITIKDLAAEMKLKASQLISKLFMQGVILTLNDVLDDETIIQILGHEFECEISIDTSEEQRLRITDKTIKQEIQETEPSSLIIRPPVVAFMGHVDHGKTSLIDAIRKTNVAAGEAGAITQHIGAFKCSTPVGDLTILDTPGHEAFSAMRSRGADVTDIVVLVIAGDEGMRTQTIEALNQAQTAALPIVVAINKCDKPNFNAENVYRQLADHNLLPEAWGGATITINCSAVSKLGIKELLEMLALQAEIQELKANPHTRARGTVIESEMHKGLGAVATVLVQNGTLRIGDALVFGQHFAKIKTMQDENGKNVDEAAPSTPVKITGLSGLPEAGSEFIVVKSEKEARDLSHGRAEGHKTTLLQQSKRIAIESVLQQKAESAEKKILNLILRADVQGSLDALKTSLLKISSNKVDINIISSGIGEISESDIQLAAASKATIIGFHTKVESHAETLIKQTKVKVKLHDIIYHTVDNVKELMLGLLDKIPQENDTGAAIIKAVFKASQLGVIAGCQVTDGTIKRNNHVRLIRDNQVIWKGMIASLKRVKEDVREVSKGLECGILLQNFNDVKEGDVLQAYEITYLEQQL
ncbi:MAG: translation initiation factor IF-2 [Anaerolineae bacterium]